MKAILLALALLAGPACAAAKDDALAAGLADCITTGAGLAFGLSEANPLGPVAACALKPAAIAYADRQPEPLRTDLLTGGSAVWTGAGVNNGAWIGAKLLGVKLASWVAPAAGFIAAAVMWERGADEREFARLCAYHKSVDPQITTCTYQARS